MGRRWIEDGGAPGASPCVLQKAAGGEEKQEAEGPV